MDWQHIKLQLFPIARVIANPIAPLILHNFYILTCIQNYYFFFPKSTRHQLDKDVSVLKYRLLVAGLCFQKKKSFYSSSEQEEDTLNMLKSFHALDLNYIINYHLFNLNSHIQPTKKSAQERERILEQLKLSI